MERPQTPPRWVSFRQGSGGATAWQISRPSAPRRSPICPGAKPSCQGESGVCGGHTALLWSLVPHSETLPTLPVRGHLLLWSGISSSEAGGWEPAGSVRGGPRLPCRPRTGKRGQGLCLGCERWPAGGCVVMIVPGEGEDLVQPQPPGQLSQGAFWARSHRCRSGPGVQLCPGNTVCFLWAQGVPLRRMNE